MSLRFTVPSSAVGDAFFDEMPVEVREFLARGFSKLASLPSESASSIATQVEKWLDPAEPTPDLNELAPDFGVDVQLMNAIMGAVTLQASALFAAKSRMSLDSFLSKATEADIFSEGSSEGARLFGEQYLKPHGAALRDALARANSSTHIVPSFLTFDATVDLRVASADSDRLVTMPIAIATLQTDIQDQRLRFQMTPRDVHQLLRQLESLRDDLNRYKNVSITEASGE